MNRPVHEHTEIRIIFRKRTETHTFANAHDCRLTAPTASAHRFPRVGFVGHHGLVVNLVRELARDARVVRTHDLHEGAVHAQDDEHLDLVVVEEGVALVEDVACAAQRALAEGLCVEGANLAVRAGAPPSLSWISRERRRQVTLAQL